MRYGLYYNLDTIGDILMIVFKSNIIPNKVIKNNDVVSLYKNDELVGINIFNISKVIKIKAKGYIPLLDNKIVDVINHILENANLNKLDYLNDSGFKVGKIIDIEEHPESKHLHLLKVDIGDKILDIVCGAYNVKLDMLVVVATLDTFMPNGQQIILSKLLGFESEGMCCSGRELNLEGYDNIRGLLELDNSYIVGSDFWTY